MDWVEATSHDLFATCPKGMESLLMAELEVLGAADTRETVAGVRFRGSLEQAYRVCLWSRLANKVLLPLGKYAVDSADDLYGVVQQVQWREHMAATAKLWIDFSGTNAQLRNTQFAAQKVKDAIVDQVRSADGRPTIEREAPDLIVNARLAKGQLVLNLDLCGESLHRRGYRVDSVKAPLKENLAAALLLRGGWPDIAANGGALLDPMCGSGTLLIEAALMAADIAPGFGRSVDPQRYFAFERWSQHQPVVWRALQEEAEQRQQQGLEGNRPDILGYDEHVLAVRATERNLLAAGLEHWIKVRRKPLQEFKRPTHKSLASGLVITNPPYGERLNDERSLEGLYRTLGDVLKSDFVGWRAAVFTGNPALGKRMGLRAQKKYKLYNGTIESELLLFAVGDQYFVDREAAGDTAISAASDRPLAEVPAFTTALNNNAQMVANRLRKNFKQLKSWREQQQIDCYRLYDADIPEYAAAIDVYCDSDSGLEYFHVQEYAPPKSVDPGLARQRLQDLLHALVVTFEVEAARVSVKQRSRQKGEQQYRALTDSPFENLLRVREGKAQLWVNLQAYLDTGLFLDHRPLRARMEKLAAGKTVLNLFCYTAAVTVQAVCGGAAGSVSVDMSNTYIQWARRNFQINAVDERKHQLIQEDVLVWLKNCRQGFDLIVLDPPSFSNSKRMRGVLDIQRDHVGLIQRCMELLAPGGRLFFSNNLRKFKLDSQALQKYRIEDITAATIDRDFQRNPKIHRCWEITQGQ